MIEIAYYSDNKRNNIIKVTEVNDAGANGFDIFLSGKQNTIL